ncbi:helix-turn-helix domain-containing protein [Paenibacillus sp. V4I5]|uniref:helix-turn-helix domain-containing protein n=1 Tax=Paenibacillus sp. V4I5 TaxID=3042306 RepID=UPI00278E8998|nr:helix-turn-helix domain-containing protein [Paenibacillus sp. V4I5]MDQ0917546.1 excisionase family DNA binding protein [Paenibacillus sp. V4I5]
MKITLSVSELSEMLGVSSDSIYALVREGQIPYIRIRRRILFHKETIDEWLIQKSLKSKN